MSKELKIGVIGASGYTGIELCTILKRHPNVELKFATSRKYSGESLSSLAPEAPDIRISHTDEVTYDGVDLVFLCLPHAASAEKAVSALEAGVKVIDLSADFRLKSAADYAEWYGRAHPAPDKMRDAVYGLTELNRDKVRGCSLLANPGCYPTSILLPLYPVLRKRDDVVSPIIADSKSGATGAGRKAKIGNLFVEVQENFHAYKIGKHRHLPEITEQMNERAVVDQRIIFTPHLLPVRRGILSTIYVSFSGEVEEAEMREAFDSVYGKERFVHLMREGESPTLKHVVHTNSCYVGITVVGKTVVLTSAIDNLVKGAAGQAVQNMNVMYEMEEGTGLRSRPWNS